MSNHRTHAAMHPLLKHLTQRNIIHERKAIFLNEKRHQAHFHLTQFILKEQWLNQTELVSFLLKCLPIPYLSVRNLPLSELPAVLSPELMQKYRVIPLRQHHHTLELGITDPFNELTLHCLRFQTGCTLIYSLISDEEFDAALNQKNASLSWSELLNQQLLQDEHLHFSSTEEQLDTPLTEFIQQLITHCNQQHASDIHFNSLQDHYRVLARIRGQLTELTRLPTSLAKRIISGLKILAQVDITEKRLPQDGRFQLESIQHVHIRAAFCPSLFGEKAVLRLLQQHSMTRSFTDLGLTDHQINLVNKQLMQTEGLILVCGATGAGKTTSLYAMLNHLNQQQKHICTIEHPVEYVLTGATQLNVQHHLGFDFASGLRALLRHDPDVILVGEIRDQETAMTALHAAETGHLVLASLHATNAIAGYFRLKHLIGNHHSLHSLSLIMAQRLVTKHEKYRGDFELLDMNSQVHDAFRCSDSEIVLQQIARQHGYIPMQ